MENGFPNLGHYKNEGRPGFSENTSKLWLCPFLLPALALLHASRSGFIQRLVGKIRACKRVLKKRKNALETQVGSDYDKNVMQL
jgi:hypothetical protein